MKKNVFAAIDLGTNSCRLVIADERGRYLYKDNETTKLGEGMYAQMRFTPEAIVRGTDCVCRYAEKMREYGVTEYRAVATAACRMASNGKYFVDLVREKSGIDIEVIDGYEEARLNLKGAVSNAKGKAPYVLVYDLGGGSTEITLAKNTENPEIIYTVSIPWGARNSSEAFDLAEFERGRAERLRAEIEKETRAFCSECRLDEYRGKVCCVATSSSPLRLVSWIRDFGSYDREKADGIEADVAEFDRVIAQVNSLSRAELAQSPYVGEKRSFIFQAASVIFKTVYDVLGVRSLTASLKSAKDGIIEELVEKYGKTD